MGKWKIIIVCKNMLAKGDKLAQVVLDDLMHV